MVFGLGVPETTPWEKQAHEVDQRRRRDWVE